MSVLCLVDQDPARLILTGSYSLDEAFTALKTIAESAPVARTHQLLFDISASEETRSAAELQMLAAHFRSLRAFERVAVVAPEDLQYGLSRMFSAFAEPDGLIVGSFHTEREALDWLALSIPVNPES